MNIKVIILLIGVFLIVLGIFNGYKSDAEENLEEQLRKQRLRQMSTGITSYMWSSTGKLLIPSGGDIYILDAVSEAPRLLVSSEHYSCVDPKISPDGELVSFVSNGEIYLVDINGGSPRQLTVGDSGKTRGLADYIAQEEMQRGTGYWWSKDSSYIAAFSLACSNALISAGCSLRCFGQ